MGGGSWGWRQDGNLPQRSKWQIKRIFLETTLMVEMQPKILSRDEARFSEIEIQKTNAWDDDNGHAAYALECTRMGEAYAIA